MAERLKIIDEARDALGREKLARDLWLKGKELLLAVRRQTRKTYPILKTSFGEEGDEVEVEISSRYWRSYQKDPDSHLDEAVILVKVGNLSFPLISPNGKYGGRWQLPKRETLENIQELLTAVEEKLHP